MTLAEPRKVCLRCRRPASACYCAHVPVIETRTRVVILQHPRERDVAIGTARMASLCLPGAKLHVGAEWGAHPGLAAAIADPARPAILLYPGPGAKDILRDPPAGPVTLIVVDGTWSQAKTVVRDNPVLASLPRYAFAAPEASEYRIRKEPNAEYVSTIEALMHVLGALEGDAPRFRGLLAPFRAMVEHQLAFQGHNLRTRHPRPPRPPRIPPEILGEVVCLAGEANAWPYRDGDHDRGLGERSEPRGVGALPASPVGRGRSPLGNDELVHVAAYRLSTDETFSFVLAPQKELSPTTTFHTGLSEARLRAGGTRADLETALAAFVRPSDILCAWGHHATNLYRETGGELPDLLDLRAAAQRLHHKKLGPLERYASTLGGSPPLCEGRAGRRLAMLRDIVTAWRERVRGSDPPPSPRS